MISIDMATKTKEPKMAPEVLMVLQKVLEMRAAQKKYHQFIYRETRKAREQLEAEVDELLDQVIPKDLRSIPGRSKS